MKLVLEAKGLEVDAWLRDYVRTTVVFATWHHELSFEVVHIQLDRAKDEGDAPYFRCGIRAERPDGQTVASGATGADACMAVQEASDLLEVSLYGFRPAATPVEPGRLAA